MKTKTNNESIYLWTDVAVFDDPEEANRFYGFLKTEGFDCRVHDERKLQRFWFWTPPQAGIQVQVAQKEFAAVEQWLDQTNGAPSLLARAIRCPSCKSLRVRYPQMTRKFILPTIVAQLLVLSGLMKRECYCENCQYTWARNAPHYPAVSGPATRAT